MEYSVARLVVGRLLQRHEQVVGAHGVGARLLVAQGKGPEAGRPAGCRRGPPKGQRSFCCQDDRPPPPLRNPVVRRIQDAPIRTVACLLHPWEGVGAAPRRPHRQAARTSSWCTAASARVRPSAMITAGDMRDGVCSCVAGAAPAPPKVQTQTAQRVGLARRRLEPA